MNVIGNKYIFLAVSGALVLGSIIAIVFLGLSQGVDFTGGTLWQLKFSTPTVTKDTLHNFFITNLKVPDAIIVSGESPGEYLIRGKVIEEDNHVSYRDQLTKAFGQFEELRFDSIGSSIGSELRQKSLTAFVLVLVTISLYIALVFRKVSRPVSSWKYGLITLLTLFHDAIIPLGLFAVLGKLLGVEVDVNFIVAVLVVMGFSVHDTIVVFDRIRENLRNARNPAHDFPTLVNDSVNQTMGRSLNTSLTLVLVLIAIFFLGSPSLHYFILTILVGVIVGTYSSIFVASPILTMWRKKG